MKKTNLKQAKTKNVSIVPLGDRLLVRPYTEDEAKGLKTNSHFGIIIPETVTKEKSAQGKVLAVGPGKYVDGKIVPIRVKVGETVIFTKYSYEEVEMNGEELYLLREDNILALVK